ncbi:RNA polymerase sigma factor [Novipirellula artificiosorum]|uniref:ECF RNA polymerase sigma factor SigL n=1 Tax=Novipirellula artificiosorum TaxID=2528016 RepID=A0A5C6E166_9BACT|nr:RNA polymerase sigma factor [Novipirellula artificiosorum]TWU42658.1 ECF RNA polymerase sigma factor SigL [Novipirellula artificiosorum]
MLNPSPQVDRPSDHDECALTVGALFDSEESPLLCYAFSLIGERAVAEDIVQEVFLQLHIHWNKVDSPRAWLFRSVRNRAYNHLRDSRREVFGSDKGDMQDPNALEETPESVLVRMEAAAALRQLLAELDESDRQLITLKYFDGLPYRDISTATGLSMGNVGYRLHHILKALAAKLGPLGIDEIS